MATNKSPSGSEVDLRKRAEARVMPDEDKVGLLSVDDADRNLHELRVYQLELEMQNEELRRTQGELEASRARYFDLYDLAPIGFFTVNNKGLIHEVNLAAATLFGLTREALLRQPFTRFIHPEEQDLYYTLRGQGDAQQVELRILRAKTGYFWGDLRCVPSPNDGYKMVLSDITERKRIEAEGRARLHFIECLERVEQVVSLGVDVEQMLRRILATVFAIFDCDRAWLLYPCDPEALSFRVPMEVSRPEYPGAEVLNEDVPMSAELALNLRDALASDEPVTYTQGTARPMNQVTVEQFGVKSQMLVPLYPRLGKPWVFGMHQCAYPRLWTKDEIQLFKEIGRRISDGLSSVLFLRELQEDETKFRAVFESSVDAIGVAKAGLHTLVNPAYLALFGYGDAGELLGKSILDCIAPASRGQVLGNMYRRAKGDPLPTFYDTRGLRKDGSEFDMNVHASSYQLKGERYTLAILRDTTERKRAEAQLRQAQKMAAIGTLAGGIAHDFNNILNAIIGFGEVVMEQLPPGSQLGEEQGQVIAAGKRARDLVKQILAFSRTSEQQAQPLLVQFVVKETLKLLRASIPASIEIREDIDINCGLVLADPVQIHQVVMNLCTNAYQAMRESGGVLTVSLRHVEVSLEFSDMTANLATGPYVRLEVGDTGCGMERAVRERIFEPYYTTKGLGEGTGLGLSLVHGIVTGLGGGINVCSEPDRGTTFKVYLPLIGGETGGEAVAKCELLPGGVESILVVDDEAAITSLERRILEGLGYRVQVFTDSMAALRAFRDQPQAFDLLLTDMTMPRMNGDLLAREILAIRPELPIVICTGFSELLDPERAKAQGIREYLQKPVEKGDLARAVRRALEGGFRENA